MSLPHRLKELDMLDERIHDLPAELEAMIKDAVFATPPAARDVRDKGTNTDTERHLRLMACDRATRAQYATAYYGNGPTILLTDVRQLVPWLVSMSAAHIALIERVDCVMSSHRMFHVPELGNYCIWSWDGDGDFRVWGSNYYAAKEAKVTADAQLFGGAELARKIRMI